MIGRYGLAFNALDAAFQNASILLVVRGDNGVTFSPYPAMSTLIAKSIMAEFLQDCLAASGNVTSGRRQIQNSVSSQRTVAVLVFFTRIARARYIATDRGSALL